MVFVERIVKVRAEGIFELVDGAWFMHTPHWGMFEVAKEGNEQFM